MEKARNGIFPNRLCTTVGKIKVYSYKKMHYTASSQQSLCSLGAYILVGKTDNTDTLMQVYKTMSGSDNCHEGN